MDQLDFFRDQEAAEESGGWIENPWLDKGLYFCPETLRGKRLEVKFALNTGGTHTEFGHRLSWLWSRKRAESMDGYISHYRIVK